MNNLNEIEFKMLEAVRVSIVLCSGNEFTYSDEVIINGLTRNQIKGYLSQLSQKGMIYIDSEYGQIFLTELSTELLNVTGQFTTF